MRKRSKMGTQGSEIGGLFNRAVGRSDYMGISKK